MAKIEIAPINRVAVMSFVVLTGAGAIISSGINKPLPLIIGGLIGIYLLFAIKIAAQWEKVALLRFGKYVGLRGTGLFFIVPVVETLSHYVDQRVRVASVSAESTLTRDTVPVNVDAIVFWLVWNAEKSIFESRSADMNSRKWLPSARSWVANYSGSSMRKQIRGVSPYSQSKSEMCAFRKDWKMPCLARRRPNASARPVSFLAKLRLKSQTTSCRLPFPIPKTRLLYTCAP